MLIRLFGYENKLLRTELNCEKKVVNKIWFIVIVKMGD